MSILIIGQSSFLASEVKKQAISKGWHFLGRHDAFDKALWPEDVQSVIGFACDPKVKNGEFSDFDRQLAQASQDVGAAYIMLSSRTVYGIPSSPSHFTETQNAHKNITPYGAAKRQIEEDLLANFDNVTILRLSNIFGFEYSVENPRQTFFGIMLKALKEKEEIYFSMNMMTQRDFMPVSIFAKQLSVIANAPQSGVYNLGSGVGTSVGDLANWVMEGYGAGRISHSGKDIIDSFILDMNKTRSTFSLEAVKTELIRESCLGIGKALKTS